MAIIILSDSITTSRVEIDQIFRFLNTKRRSINAEVHNDNGSLFSINNFTSGDDQRSTAYDQAIIGFSGGKTSSRGC